MLAQQVGKSRITDGGGKDRDLENIVLERRRSVFQLNLLEDYTYTLVRQVFKRSLEKGSVWIKERTCVFNLIMGELSPYQTPKKSVIDVLSFLGILLKRCL